MRSPGPDVDAPLDSLESNFHMGSDVDFRPKLVNGKGPLDNLLRNRVKSNIGQTMVVIDLTEESSDLPDDIGAHSKLNSAASPSAKSVSGVREEAEGERGLLKASPKDKPAFPEETLSDRSAEEEGAGSGGAGRSRDVQKGSPRSCPALTDGPRTRSEKAWDGWSEAGGILFRGKVPVVVLQDVLAAEPPAARAPAAAADQGMPSESEMPESGPEEDSVLSLSSLSSCSPTSSPEGRSASGKQHGGPGPFPTCTPVRRVSTSPGPSAPVLVALESCPSAKPWGRGFPQVVSGKRVGPQSRSCDYRCRILCVTAILVTVAMHACLGVLVRFAVVGVVGLSRQLSPFMSAFGLSSLHSFLSHH